MLKDAKEFLKHIQDESLYIISVTRDLSFDAFLEDEISNCEYSVNLSSFVTRFNKIYRLAKFRSLQTSAIKN